MSTARVIFFLCAAVACSASAARAELVLRFIPETASPFLHEPFTLRLEMESDGPPEAPALPSVPGIAVLAVHRLPADPARRLHAFQISLIAERGGAVVIPPFEVSADGERSLTPALRLLIRAPRPASGMTLSISVEPRELRVGEAATLTATWTSATPFSRCHQLHLEIPLLADPRCQAFPLDPQVPEPQRTGLPVNHLRVAARSLTAADGRHSLSFSYQLIPREPCVLRPRRTSLVCALLDDARPAGEEPSHFYNQFFSSPPPGQSFERIYLFAPMPEIRVRALPEQGRNSHFAEIVGPCTLRATLTPERLQVGQPGLFTVHLEGLAFARHLPGLPAAALAGLRPEFHVSPQPIREAASSQSRSFTYVLRPLRAGRTRVPAVVIQTFDPGTEAYQTLRSASIPLMVEPDPDGASTGTFPSRVDAQVPVPLDGIGHNRIDDQAMMFLNHLLEFLGRLWWLLLPLPPLAWLLLRPLARKWERCRRDPAFARAVSALPRFRRAAGLDEETAWRSYLADRLDLCAGALTADTVAAALQARQVDPALIAETRQRLQARDAADYGKRTLPGAPSTADLVRRLQRATVPLLLLASCFLPQPGHAADTAGQWFARAMQMRGEKPDEAQPLFTEAALRFESAGCFLNAGNAWFFAGETGRALANYRSAQRRWPFDRQVRESIRFLRANRADSLPAPATPGDWLAGWWQRFGEWAPVLRAGLFLLIYLVASLLFLLSQMLGWRLPRTAWALLAGMALVPLLSLTLTPFQPGEGVVIEDTTARQGPGYAYEPAFRQSLHRAAEFAWLETRQGWVRAYLPGAGEGWLRESDCWRVK